MAKYKKITKDDIDFPNYCFFFIKEIIDSLEEHDIKEPGDELTLEIGTHEYPYCYDAMALIVKTFERMGYNTRTPTYKLTKEDDIKTYTYKWKLVKSPNLDDLPF